LLPPMSAMSPSRSMKAMWAFCNCFCRVQPSFSRGSASPMGCRFSELKGDHNAKPGERSGGDEKPLKSTKEGVLLDHYTLGPVLGQGAFGVVYQCTKKSATGEFAVKMIDKVESPVDEIGKEAEMMRDLDHPNIVKLHEVFYEKCFVCIVMDRFKGGDLIVGMQKHWKSKGKIAADSAVHIMKQMVASVAHLHGRNIVHRDIKGDNYLMDDPDIIKPTCQIFLSDFGTATGEWPKTGYFSRSVGTRTYWAPEFYNKKYGLKVDVWAIGVVVYGLLDGRFPFKGEPDVRYKKVSLGPRIPDLCKNFVGDMLCKEEAKRPSSTEVLEHDWLRKGGASSKGGGDEDTKFEVDTMREGGANEGIQERRQELVERLQKKAGTGAAQTSSFW